MPAVGPFLRLQLHLAASVQRGGIRPYSTVLHQSIFCERASARRLLAASTRLLKLILRTASTHLSTCVSQADRTTARGRSFVRTCSSLPEETPSRPTASPHDRQPRMPSCARENSATCVWNRETPSDACTGRSPTEVRTADGACSPATSQKNISTIHQTSAC